MVLPVDYFIEHCVARKLSKSRFHELSTRKVGRKFVLPRASVITVDNDITISVVCSNEAIFHGAHTAATEARGSGAPGCDRTDGRTLLFAFVISILRDNYL